MPRREKKLRKSTTGPCTAGTSERAPTHSTAATDLPARSAAWAMWSAWRIPVAAKLVELLKLPSPVRWNVLFVDPCSPGQVPVPSVAHPTPVFGGKPCVRPFCPLTPLLIRLLIAGMAPSAAYRSTRSGLMPSEAKSTTLSARGFGAAAAPPPANRDMGTTVATVVQKTPMIRDQC